MLLLYCAMFQFHNQKINDTSFRKFYLNFIILFLTAVLLLLNLYLVHMSLIVRLDLFDIIIVMFCEAYNFEASHYVIFSIFPVTSSRLGLCVQMLSFCNGRTVEPAYNEIGLDDTSPIKSNILR
jgi:hypothetical protein